MSERIDEGMALGFVHIPGVVEVDIKDMGVRIVLQCLQENHSGLKRLKRKSLTKVPQLNG
jgi:hypothetical protein